MILYAVWGILQGIFQFINGFFFSIGGASAAKALHHRALKNIFRAPSSFFDTTPLGMSSKWLSARHIVFEDKTSVNHIALTK